MRQVLVLGLGNRLMMDDGIGVAVVEALARQQPPDKGFRYEIGETDVEHCLDLALEAEMVLLVDAAFTGRRPGEVTVFPLPKVGVWSRGISQHHLHFVDLLLQVDRQKGGALIGIEPYQIGFHWGLSPEMEKCLAEVVRDVQVSLRQVASELQRKAACVSTMRSSPSNS